MKKLSNIEAELRKSVSFQKACNSLNNKITNTIAICSNSQMFIININETKLDFSFQDSQIHIKHYKKQNFSTK